MQAVTTIGLDIAKSIFQLHGVDAAGNGTFAASSSRRYVLPFFQELPPCLVGTEACASCHHWSLELQALGHTMRLMPPAYVKPYLKRQRNDAAPHLLSANAARNRWDSRNLYSRIIGCMLT
jgi:transposase